MKTRTGRKVIPALIAVLASLVIVSTATFAWFSMNTTVSGTDISLTTTAPTNMQISSDLINWSNGTISNTASLSGYSPASTTNGKDFFALSSTEGLDVRGGIASTGSTLKFGAVGRTGSSATYYAAIPLYIRASDESDSDELHLCLETFDVDVIDIAGSSGVAYNATLAEKLKQTCRISITQVTASTPVTADDFTGTGTITVNGDGSLSGIPAAGTITEGAAVIYKYDTDTAVKPIAAANSSGTVSLGDDAAIAAGPDTVDCFVVDATGGHYTTIVIRIWLEGQHENCINEVAGQAFDISLEWRVKSN